ncbi:ATP-binding cassette domain-containing protein, partial [Myroides injenensis]
LKQHNAYDLKLKVKELIAFGRFPHSQGNLTLHDQNKIDEAIDIMNLTNMSNAYIDEISGGQLQRVFLAMVFAQDTDYILLDEPLNNLDMKHCLSTMQLTEQLVKEYNKTIIMVIHDINFAANYSDIIIGMKEGKIVCIDKTENIIKEDILKDLYDINFKVIQDNNSLICNYYKP